MRKTPFPLIIYLLLLGFTLLLTALSPLNPKSGKTAFFLQPGIGGKEQKTGQAVDISKVSFDFNNLPPLFEVIVGGKCYDYYQEVYSKRESSNNARRVGSTESSDTSITLSDILGNHSFLPDSFWLISPFYEPREFFFQDFDLQRPIDLSSLASAMTSANLVINKLAPSVLQIGPALTARISENGAGNFYDWSSDNTIVLYSPPKGAGLVSVADNNSDFNFMFCPFVMNCAAVSPDAQKVAYIDKGYLAVVERASGQLKKWALTDNPESQSLASFSTELLEWSPNGRYILGSANGYYDFYHYKLWVLDLTTGLLSGFNAYCNHAFKDPVWSPDGNKVVVTELFKPYSNPNDGQWVLLDMFSKKIFSVAGKDKSNTSYDFTWDSSGKLITNNQLSNQIEFFDPALGIEQQKFLNSSSANMERYLATNLEFRPPDGPAKFSVNFSSALEDCGLNLQDIYTLLVEPLGMYDNNRLFLQVKAATQNNVRTYICYGRLDLTTKQVSFLQPFWTTESPKAAVQGQPLHASGCNVLLLPDQDSIIVINLLDMTYSKKRITGSLLAACWVGDRILYITDSGVFLTEGTEESLQIYQTGDGESFRPEIKLSPNGRYLAIPKLKPHSGILDEISLLIIELNF